MNRIVRILATVMLINTFAASVLAMWLAYTGDARVIAALVASVLSVFVSALLWRIVDAIPE
jgi:hypothetical protein